MVASVVTLDCQGGLASGLKAAEDHIRSDRVRLVLDLGPVESVDGLTLSSLLGVYRKIQAQGGRLVLCNLTPPVREALERTSLIRFLPVAADVEQARSDALT